MKNNIILLTAVVVTAVVTSYTTLYFSTSSIKGGSPQFNEKVAEFIENHPDVIKKSIEKAIHNEARAMEQRQEEKIAESQNLLIHDPDSPILGNKTGEKLMVLFTDPLCGFCRKFHLIVLKAIKENKNLKVIVKDYPIIGGQKSLEIIQMALAAKKQGKYLSFMNEVFHQNSYTQKDLMKIAKKVGLNIKKLKTEIKNKKIMDLVRKNLKLGRDLGIGGTPAFIIGNRLHEGYRDFEDLKQILEKS